MNNHEDENELAKSLVYWVSRRGASNYWAALINGTDKVYTNSDGTMSVQLAPNWRYILTCHLPFFEACSPKMRLLVLVHEAGHIALNHIPRLFRMMANCTDPIVRMAIMSTFNWAADFAANDSLVRLEPGFKDVHKPKNSEKGEWHFLMPEEWDLPKDKSMEEYIALMLKDISKWRDKMEKLLKDLSDGNFVFVPRDYGDRNHRLPSSIPGLPDFLIRQAMKNPEIFDMMQQAFDQLSGKAHRDWNEKAKGMTPEEAISAGNKMKNHAKQLARSANDRLTRDRGFISGNAQRIIDALLQPEKLPWDLFLRDIIQGAINARVGEEMGAPNLALINEDFIEPWPGQVLEFGFRITWMTDTSGSMDDIEYARACACLNGLLGTNKNIHVTYVECDAALQKEVQVNNVEPPDEEYLKELRTRRGYGGTVYVPFFKRLAGVDEKSDWVEGAPRLEERHPYPDLVVIVTDGGVAIDGECFPKYRPTCPIIWLVTPGNHAVPGMSDVAPDRVVEMFSMKDEEG